MFFEIDTKYIVNEINNSPQLRGHFQIKSILNYNELANLLSYLESNQILEFVLKTINQQFVPSKRGKKTTLIDATHIILDINLDRKYYNNEELGEKNFEFGFFKHMDIILVVN